MNINPVGQHSKAQALRETNQAILDDNPILTFQGQLQFAESDLELLTPDITAIEGQRDYHKEIEKRRQSDDQDKATALSYWNNQQQENRIDLNQSVRQHNNTIQKQTEQEKDQTSQQVIQNLSTTKKLNQTVSQEKIKLLKPHLIASALQESGPQSPKPEFGELLQAKFSQLGNKSPQPMNQASVSEFPVNTEQINPVGNQAQLRNDRNTFTVKPTQEKAEGIKSASLQSHNQQSSSNADYRMGKVAGSETAKETKHNQVKPNGFNNELNSALKSDQTTETDASNKPGPTKEVERPQVKDVVNNVKIMLSSGKDTIVIRLTPEHLGKLEIKLKKTGDTLSGEFKVESLETKKLLQSEFLQLQQDLQNQGIKLEHYTILVKGEGEGAFSQNSQGQHQQSPSGERPANQNQVSSTVAEPAFMGSMSRIKTDSGVNIII